MCPIGEMGMVILGRFRIAPGDRPHLMYIVVKRPTLELFRDLRTCGVVDMQTTKRYVPYARLAPFRSKFVWRDEGGWFSYVKNGKRQYYDRRDSHDLSCYVSWFGDTIC